jgi:hypothetical protein
MRPVLKSTIQRAPSAKLRSMTMCAIAPSLDTASAHSGGRPRDRHRRQPAPRSLQHRRHRREEDARSGAFQLRLVDHWPSSARTLAPSAARARFHPGQSVTRDLRDQAVRDVPA